MTASSRRATVSLLLAVLAFAAPAQDSRPDTRPLANEKSPYLRQHLDNPVVWYPWGDEAFAKAARENKPVFLSIGYASCHWCHVMEHESFENAALAALLNESYVAVKVDREERPDVDRVYMHATTMMTGRGGWPLSLFLTPDRKPFFAATYMPLEDQPNQTGFKTAIVAIRDAWATRRPALVGSADRLDAALKSSQLSPDEIESRAAGLESRAAAEAESRPNGPIAAELAFLRELLTRKKTPPPDDLLAAAAGQLLQLEDKTFGGFGEDQKFPVPLDALALLRDYARRGRLSSLEAVKRQYEAMWRGGIHDWLAGGFHRYATDRQWEIPHFEKMLYDQALIARVYLELAQATGGRGYESLCKETLDFCLATLRAEGGGFIAALDATIDGQEGATYLWTKAEIAKALVDVTAEDVASFERDFGFDRGKPAEKRTLALRPASAPESRAPANASVPRALILLKLLLARNDRPQPARVGHVITSWNAWLVSALARAAMILNEPKYRDAALETMAFLDAKLRQPDGLYARRYFEGETRFAGELSDQAAVLQALLDLHEMTLDPKWLARAEELVPKIVARFGRADGSFDDSVEKDLIFRTRETSDGSVPSGTSQMNVGLARLARMTGKPADLERARKAIRAVLPDVGAGAADHAYGAIAWDLAFKPVARVAFVGPPAVLQALRAPMLLSYRPFVVMTSPPPVEPGIDRVRAHAVVEVDGDRSEPLTDSAALLQALERAFAPKKPESR